eukprot:1079867-Amphidinium_carterae.1
MSYVHFLEVVQVAEKPILSDHIGCDVSELPPPLGFTEDVDGIDVQLYVKDNGDATWTILKHFICRARMYLLDMKAITTGTLYTFDMTELGGAKMMSAVIQFMLSNLGAECLVTYEVRKPCKKKK